MCHTIGGAGLKGHSRLCEEAAPHPGTRETGVEVDRTFAAATRLEAGLTQQEFVRAAGASLGTVRKWERGERSPSGAARMLMRILARDPALLIAEAGWQR